MCITCLVIDRVGVLQEDFKTHELPLARIKKIMRLEDDIAEAGAPRFMIAAEAPIIIAKACEIFVLEVRDGKGAGAGKWVASGERDTIFLVVHTVLCDPALLCHLGRKTTRTHPTESTPSK